MSTIVIGGIVFIGLALIVFRLIKNTRKGKAPCGCEGCSKCS